MLSTRSAELEVLLSAGDLLPKDLGFKTRILRCAQNDRIRAQDDTC